MSPHDSDIPGDQLAERLWQELVRAPHDRHHDWRTPVLATQGLGDSGPQARAVVLRHADAKLWRLRVYTEIANDSITIPSYFENRFMEKSGMLRVLSALVILIFFTLIVKTKNKSCNKKFVL